MNNFDVINLWNVDFEALTYKFTESEPYNHIVIDNFFQDEVAQKLVDEFPVFDSEAWCVTYNSPIETYKKVCNHWDRFPKETYRVVDWLNRNYFVKCMETLTGLRNNLFVDPGLHGGGWHSHKNGGKLNIHKDYSIHPKLGLERRLNLIVYLTPDWKPEYGGGLELWSNRQDLNTPWKCEKVIENKFNRAIIFDTTQNSWHGLPRAITCPDNVYRQSLAVYYMSRPKAGVDPRGRALFHPYGDQADDKDILELIEKRAK